MRRSRSAAEWIKVEPSEVCGACGGLSCKRAWACERGWLRTPVAMCVLPVLAPVYRIACYPFHSHLSHMKLRVTTRPESPLLSPLSPLDTASMPSLSTHYHLPHPRSLPLSTTLPLSTHNRHEEQYDPRHLVPQGLPPRATHQHTEPPRSQVRHVRARSDVRGKTHEHACSVVACSVVACCRSMWCAHANYIYRHSSSLSSSSSRRGPTSTATRRR